MSDEVTTGVHAVIQSHYDGLIEAIKNADPDPKFDVVTSALTRHLAAALALIEIQNERIDAIECEVLRLMAFVSGVAMPEGDGDV